MDMTWTQDELALIKARAESTATSPLNDLLMLIVPAFALQGPIVRSVPSVRMPGSGNRIMFDTKTEPA
jgi:hypothetical protein